MDEYIRVREGGWEITIAKRLRHKSHEVLDKPALLPSGEAVPPKPVTPLGTPRSGSKQARARASRKSAAAAKETKAGQSSANTTKE